MRVSVMVAAGFLGGLPLAPIAAQQARDSVPRADSARNDSALVLSPIVVTATMEPIRMDRIGFSSSVVTTDDDVRRPATAVGQVLRRLPDVFIDEGAGPGGPAVVRIRGGEEPYTKVLWDGVPINISGGFLDLQGLTLSNVERVEVARGPHSAIHGSSAMNGVVQFFTRRGAVGRPVVEAMSETGRSGDFGQTARGEVSVHGGVPSFLYSAGGAVAYDRGIYALPNNAWTRDGSLRLDATPSARLGVTATARYENIETNLPVRDPGATRAPLDPNQRDARRRLVSSVVGTLKATPSWTHRLSLGVLRDDFFYDDITDGVTQPPGFFISDFTLTDRAATRRATLEYTASNRFGWASGDAALSYGGSVERETTGDVLTGDFGNSDIDFRRTSEAGFAELQAGLGQRVSLLGGARVERYQGLPVQLTPRGSLVFTAVPGRLLIRGAVGRSFKVPNLQQQYLDNPFTLPNPNLAPERAVSWEAGATVTSSAARERLGLTYFHEEYRDLIRTVPVIGDTRSINRNLGKSMAEGVELEFAYRLSAAFNAGANATWLRTEVQENSGLAPDQYPLGEELPFRPHLIGTAHVETAVGRLSGEVHATVTGPQTVLTERFGGQRAVVAGYTLFGLTLSYETSRWLSVFATGENLLDTRYETAYDHPGAPFRLTAGARLTS